MLKMLVGLLLLSTAFFLNNNAEAFSQLPWHQPPLGSRSVTTGKSVGLSYYYRCHHRKIFHNSVKPTKEIVLFVTDKVEDSNTNDSDNDNDKKELTIHKIAEMIEISFIQACMQLSQGYIDVLKLFIASVKAGYDRKISLEELESAVLSCPIQSAGRDLMEEETLLRKTWLHVIYLVLDIYYNKNGISSNENSDRNGQTYDGTVKDSYMQAIPLLINMKQNEDAGQKALQVDEFIENNKDILPLFDSSNPLEKAIITQTLRVVWLTLTVIEEEEQCIQDKSSGSSVKKSLDSPPRPPIPGAF